MKRELILNFIQNNPLISSKDIYAGLEGSLSYATVKRFLSKLSHEGLVIKEGVGKGTKYAISPTYKLFYPINVDAYFIDEQDQREIKSDFNYNLITDTLAQVSIFTLEEISYLDQLHQKFTHNISKLSPSTYHKELERLAIDLSWKSSQIEGNTYSLLETERLLKEKETALGKPKDDATMLLNHKEALNFIIEHPDYAVPLSIRSIEDIHSILIRDLGVDRNIRQSRVGITGTNILL